MKTKTYAVKEMHYTVQGEGTHSGRAAVFIRFTGCNLWNGKEESRMSSPCRFCDTDFIGTDGHLGGRYTASDLVKAIEDEAPSLIFSSLPLLVLTGGEPLLQVDQALIQTLQSEGFYVAIETNGTQALDGRTPDWVCCSPKTEPEAIKIERIDELKVVYPLQSHIQANLHEFRAQLPHARDYWLQPMDETHYDSKVQSPLNSVISYVKVNPVWGVSLQTHKTMNIP